MSERLVVNKAVQVIIVFMLAILTSVVLALASSSIVKAGFGDYQINGSGGSEITYDIADGTAGPIELGSLRETSTGNPFNIGDVQLVAGVGDNDNSSFSITPWTQLAGVGALTFVGTADLSSQSTYSIRLEFTDSATSEKTEEVFTFNVIQNNGAPIEGFLIADSNGQLTSNFLSSECEGAVAPTVFLNYEDDQADLDLTIVSAQSESGIFSIDPANFSSTYPNAANPGTHITSFTLQIDGIDETNYLTADADSDGVYELTVAVTDGTNTVNFSYEIELNLREDCVVVGGGSSIPSELGVSFDKKFTEGVVDGVITSGDSGVLEITLNFDTVVGPAVTKDVGHLTLDTLGIVGGIRSFDSEDLDCAATGAVVKCELIGSFEQGDTATVLMSFTTLEDSIQKGTFLISTFQLEEGIDSGILTDDSEFACSIELDYVAAVTDSTESEAEVMINKQEPPQLAATGYGDTVRNIAVGISLTIVAVAVARRMYVYKLAQTSGPTYRRINL